MGNIEKMTIEQWESKYKPIVNPNAEDEYSADRFETCGEDLDFVLNVANTTPKKVWTLEDIDGQLIICAGYHLVNRINYFVTEIEWEDEDIQVQYCDEDAEINESAIQKALKDMLDHVMILNDNEKLSSDTLITMAVDALFEDEEYGSFVDKNSERAYLQQIADALSKKGLTFYDTNVLDVEICSECGIVLLPDDECYESHKGEPLCAGCSFRCECCDQYFKKEEVRESINGYSCKSCELQDFMQKNILSEEEKDDLIAEIYSWHENCEHGQNGECEIFNAIEQGAEDDEVISIAFKVDRDLFDKFEKIPKYIESVSTKKVELDLYECTCGFHLGIDATYLEQVSEVSIVCPSCGNSILTTEHDGCNSDSLENKSKPFDANNYTSRQLLEMEFQNVPNSTHKDNLIAEALQLVKECGYTVGEATNEVNVANLTPRYCIVQNTDEEGSSEIHDLKIGDNCLFYLDNNTSVIDTITDIVVRMNTTFFVGSQIMEDGIKLNSSRCKALPVSRRDAVEAE